MSADFGIALSIVLGAHSAMRPPNRVPVSQGAAETLIIKKPGSATTPWSVAETPYMREPMDMLASRLHDGVVFAGPAQSGKTAALGEGWLAHNVVNDPGDMLIVQMTQDKAREYSKDRIDRMLEHSPKIHALKGPSSRDDNLHDKQFVHGMRLKLAWPTVPNLSSTSYRYTFLTDYDRMPDNVGEGDAWGMAQARSRTFMSRGMNCAESSPGRQITDPNWTPATPHEAPPCGGILGLYNRSDRRRWNWQCPHCEDWFEAKPGMALFGLPDETELIANIRRLDIDKLAQEYNRVVCPRSGCEIGPEHKAAMNRGGVWVPDGCKVVGAGRIIGEPRTSTIAGYWLGGVAATFSTWASLIRKYLSALLEYATTGEETAWQTTTNTDQGAPYTSRRLVESKRDLGPEDRKEPDLERFVCPAETRCILASVDVQGGLNARFIVQAHAIGQGFEQWPIDRYTIVDSRRAREGGGFEPVNPAVYPEDWDVLTERVLRSTYRIAGSDREMRIHLTTVDTGGEQRKGPKGNVDEGVAPLAYAWYRRLRKDGLHKRVRLVKGTGAAVTWYYRETEVGGKNGAGDVPLFLLNSNLLKDAVDGALGRLEKGPGFVHIPDWWPPQMFEELHAETRNADGTWTKHRARNETFDLMYYIRAGGVILGMDKLKFWQSPPSWALPVAENTDTMSRTERRDMRDNELVGYVPAPAPKEPAEKRPRGRRSARSSVFG